MTYYYEPAWEWLFKSIDTLITSKGRLSERLEAAYECSLLHLQKEDLPDELQERFIHLTNELSNSQIYPLTDQKAEKLANEILSLYDQIARQYCS